MAQFTTEAGIDGLTGKFSKHSRLVMRQKEWHYPDGRVFGCGPKEVYAYEKRDYKRDPRTPAEQAQYERWKAVCQEASRIAKDPNRDGGTSCCPTPRQTRSRPRQETYLSVRQLRPRSTDTRVRRNACFSSKCGSKSIDLDKKHMFFFQMWVKKYRFGQKTQNSFGQFKKLLYLCTGF